MRVTINRKNFLEALAIGGAQAGKSRALPILDCVKVNIKGEYVLISSFDNECCVLKRTRIVESDGDGLFCVNASDLTKALKSLRDEDVMFVINDNIMTIHHKKGEMSLPTFSAEEFPAIVKGEDSKKFTMKAEKLFEWVNNSKNFVSNDDFRPQLKGLYWYIEGNEIGVAASDGTKLYSDFYRDENVNDNAHAIVSSNSFNTILSLINGVEDVEITIDTIHVTFAVEDAKITCILPEQKYPRFKSIIPQNNNILVTIDKNELRDMINRASLFANQSSALVVLNAQGMNLDMSAEDLDFNKKSKESTIVEHSGNDIRIGLKASFLLDCLQVIESDKITLKMLEPTRAILVYDDNNPNASVLLMPMQIID